MRKFISPFRLAGEGARATSRPKIRTEQQSNEYLASYKKATKEPRQVQRILVQPCFRSAERENGSLGGETYNPNGLWHLSGPNSATTQLPWFIAHGSRRCL